MTYHGRTTSRGAKFLAWLLTVMLVFTSMPTAVLAEVFEAEPEVVLVEEPVETVEEPASVEEVEEEPEEELEEEPVLATGLASKAASLADVTLNSVDMTSTYRKAYLSEKTITMHFDVAYTLTANQDVTRDFSQLNISAETVDSAVAKVTKTAFTTVKAAIASYDVTIKLVGEGTTQLNVQAENLGKSVDAAATIEVENDIPEETPVPVQVLALDLAVADDTIAVGDTTTAGVTLIPCDAANQAVTYSSSDVTVASVNENGVISGIKAGTAIIKVTSVSNPEVTAEKVITVTDADILVAQDEITITVPYGFGDEVEKAKENGTDYSTTAQKYATQIPVSLTGSTATITYQVQNNNTGILALLVSNPQANNSAFSVYPMGIGEGTLTIVSSLGATKDIKVTVVEAPAAEVVVSFPYQEYTYQIEYDATLPDGTGVGFNEQYVSPTTAKVTYKSTNTAVANVQTNSNTSFTVLANGEGDATIYAVDENGTKCTGEMVVHVVRKAKPEIVEVYIDDDDVEDVNYIGDGTLYTPAQAFYLKDTNLVADDTAVLTYTSSNESVAVIDGEGVVTLLSAGTTVITATAENGVYDSYVLNVEDKVVVIPNDDITIYMPYGFASEAEKIKKNLEEYSSVDQAPEYIQDLCVCVPVTTNPAGLTFVALADDAGKIYVETDTANSCVWVYGIGVGDSSFTITAYNTNKEVQATKKVTVHVVECAATESVAHFNAEEVTITVPFDYDYMTDRATALVPMYFSVWPADTQVGYVSSSNENVVICEAQNITNGLTDATYDEVFYYLPVDEGTAEITVYDVNGNALKNTLKVTVIREDAQLNVGTQDEYTIKMPYGFQQEMQSVLEKTKATLATMRDDEKKQLIATTVPTYVQVLSLELPVTSDPLVDSEGIKLGFTAVSNDVGTLYVEQSEDTLWIYGLSVGTGTVTVYGDNGITKTITVNVVENEAEKAVAAFNTSNVEITIPFDYEPDLSGKTTSIYNGTMAYKVWPADTLVARAESSDPGVVLVMNNTNDNSTTTNGSGKISYTIVGEGTAEITLYDEKGDAIENTLTVTVVREETDLDVGDTEVYTIKMPYGFQAEMQSLFENYDAATLDAADIKTYVPLYVQAFSVEIPVVLTPATNSEGTKLGFLAETNDVGTLYVEQNDNYVWIYGLSVGEGTVTITGENGVSKTIKVKVEEMPAEEAVASFSPSSKVVAVPYYYNIYADDPYTADPQKQIEVTAAFTVWPEDTMVAEAVSSDPSVATVELDTTNNKVELSIIKTGTTTVTLKDEKGDTISGEFVLVVEEYQPEYINWYSPDDKVTTEAVHVFVGEYAPNYYAQVDPQEASQAIYYWAQDPDILEVDEDTGAFYAKKAGVTFIYARSKVEPSLIASLPVEVDEYYVEIKPDSIAIALPYGTHNLVDTKDCTIGTLPDIVKTLKQEVTILCNDVADAQLYAGSYDLVEAFTEDPTVAMVVVDNKNWVWAEENNVAEIPMTIYGLREGETDIEVISLRNHKSGKLHVTVKECGEADVIVSYYPTEKTVNIPWDYEFDGATLDETDNDNITDTIEFTLWPYDAKEAITCTYDGTVINGVTIDIDDTDDTDAEPTAAPTPDPDDDNYPEEAATGTITYVVVNEGDTTIKLYNERGTEYIGECVVHIVRDERPEAEYVTFTENDQDEDTLYVGEYFMNPAYVCDKELNPDLEPVQDITYISSNPEVAVVNDQGVITALSAGATVIYAKASNGVQTWQKINVLDYTLDFSTDDEITLYMPYGFENETNAIKENLDSSSSLEDVPVYVKALVKKVYVTTNNKLEWLASTNNEAIAYIEQTDDSIRVYGVGVGTTVVKFTLYDDGGSVKLTKYLKVNVVELPAAEGVVSYEAEEIYIEIPYEYDYATTTEKKTAEATYTIWPEDIEATAASSSDETVAIVTCNPTPTGDNGTDTISITAVNEGTANITLFDEKGNALKNTLKVTVVRGARALPTAIKWTENYADDDEYFEMYAGKVMNNPAIITGEDGRDIDTTAIYSSSDTSVATVDENGNVKAISKGYAVITAKSQANPALETSYIVFVKEYTTDIVSENEFTMYMPYGFSDEMKAALANIDKFTDVKQAPAYVQYLSKVIVVESVPEDAEFTVSSANVGIVYIEEVESIHGFAVYAIGEGTDTITVTTEYGAEEIITVHVVESEEGQAVAHFDPANIHEQIEYDYEAGDAEGTYKVTFTVWPESVTIGHVESSDECVVIASLEELSNVDPDDSTALDSEYELYYTIIGEGEATITVYDDKGNKLNGELFIHVERDPQPIATEVAFNEGDDQVLFVGDTYADYATVVEPKTADQAIGYSSSNPEVASVNAEGVVVANKAGTAVITAYAVKTPNVVDTYIVTVKDYELNLGNSEEITIVMPYGFAKEAEAIKAALDSTSNVKDAPYYVQYLSVKVPVTVIGKEDATDFTAIADNAGILYVEEADECFYVYGIGLGTANVVVTAENGITKSVKVTVVEAEAEAAIAHFNEADIHVQIPYEYDYQNVVSGAVVEPVTDVVTGTVELTIWPVETVIGHVESSDECVAMVAVTESVTGDTVAPYTLTYTIVGEGETVITVYDEKGVKLEGELTIHVERDPQPIAEEVTFEDGDDKTLFVGKSDVDTAKITPELADQEVAYVSSNPEVASVNGEGVVVANKAGTAVITAYAVKNPEVKVSYVVTVKDYELNLGNSEEITIEMPYGFAKEAEAIKAAIDENSSIEDAPAYVVALDVKVPVEIITDEETSDYTAIADTAGIIWIDSKDAKEFHIYGIGVGTANVVVTASNGITKTIKVNVVEKEAEGALAHFDMADIHVQIPYDYDYQNVVGEEVTNPDEDAVTGTVELTIWPEDIVIGHVESSDECVAMVTLSQEKEAETEGNTYELTYIVVGDGETVITVYDEKGVKLDGELTIHVERDPQPIATDIELEADYDDETPAEIFEGQTISNAGVINPATADQEIVYVSSNPEVATVDSEGVVTGVKKGETTITAYAKKNPEVQVSYKVIVKANELNLGVDEDVVIVMPYGFSMECEAIKANIELTDTTAAAPAYVARLSVEVPVEIIDENEINTWTAKADNAGILWLEKDEECFYIYGIGLGTANVIVTGSNGLVKTIQVTVVEADAETAIAHFDKADIHVQIPYDYTYSDPETAAKKTSETEDETASTENTYEPIVGSSTLIIWPEEIVIGHVESSDECVAMVAVSEEETEDGISTVVNYTIVDEGEATITVYDERGVKLEGELYIHVKRVAQPIATDVVLAHTDTPVELFEGDTYGNAATIEPALADQEVVYESSNPEVAIVDENGVVTALEKGETTITVYAKKKPDVRTSYQVNVKAYELNLDIDDDVVLVMPYGFAMESEAIKANLEMTDTVSAAPAYVARLSVEVPLEIIGKEEDPSYTVVADKSGIVYIEAGKEHFFIYGIGVGTTTLTVAASNGVNKTLQVTVMEADPEKGIAHFNKSDIHVQIPYAYTPNDALSENAIGGDVELTIWPTELTIGHVESSDECVVMVELVNADEAEYKEIEVEEEETESETEPYTLHYIAVGEGDAIITVYDERGIKLDGDLYIHVERDPQPVATEIFGIDTNSVTIYEGQTYENAGIISPEDADQEIVYISSNPAIATVDEEGVVTGVKKGETTITAYAKKNPEVYTSYKVTVLAYELNLGCEDELTIILPYGSGNELKLIQEKWDNGEDYTPDYIDLLKIDVPVTTDPEDALYTFTADKSGIVYLKESEDGFTIYGMGVGDSTVTVACDNGVTKTVLVHVIEAEKPTASIASFAEQEITVYVPYDYQFVAGADDVKTGTATFTYWKPETTVTSASSSDELVANAMKVEAEDGTGTVEFVINGLGTTEVTVFDKFGTALEGKLTIHVLREERIDADEITVEEEDISMIVGEVATNPATISPAKADQSVTYESENPAIASIDENGVIHANGKGETYITVTSVANPELTAKYKVTVKRGDPTELVAEDEVVYMKRGETKNVPMSYLPEDAELDGWEVVSVTPNNELVTATINGSENIVIESSTTAELTETECVLTVVATNGTKTLNCNIKVIVSDDAVVIEEKEEGKDIEIMVGDKVSLKDYFVVEPETSFDKANFTIDDTTIASLSGIELTGTKVGTTYITGRLENGMSTTIKVIVNKNDVESVAIAQADGTTLYADDEGIEDVAGSVINVSAVIDPENATYKDVTWEVVDPTVAKVEPLDNSTGMAQLTLLKPGTTTLILRSVDNPEAFDTLDITVGIAMEDLAIDPSYTEKYPGEDFTYTLTIVPEDYVMVEDKLEWSSSDESVATVDDYGHLIPKKPGTATITVKYTDPLLGTVYTRTATVVVKTPVESLTFNPDELTKYVGQYEDLYERIIWNDGNSTPTDTSVTWVVEDSSIVTVDSTGNLKALKAGDTNVYAYAYNGVYGRIHVTVLENAGRLTLDTYNVSIWVGEQATINATVNPESATDEFIWNFTTNNYVAEVNEETVAGNRWITIEGLKPGKYSFTATLRDKNAGNVETVVNKTIYVTVKEPATTIEVDSVTPEAVGTTYPKTVTARRIGQNIWLYATLWNDKVGLDDDTERVKASDQSVTWESLNPEIATVDENGLLTAVKTGRTTIKATSVSNPDVWGTINVIVIKDELQMVIDPDEMWIDVGETGTITGIVELDGVKINSYYEIPDDIEFNVIYSNPLDQDVKPEVASIEARKDDEGNFYCIVKGMNPGDIIVEATFYGDIPEYTQTYRTTVHVNNPVVDLNTAKKYLTILVGEKYAYNLEEELEWTSMVNNVLPTNTNVTYDIENPEIITIDNYNRIVGLQVGGTQVDVISEDDPTKKVTIYVEVVDIPTGIYVDAKEIMIYPEDEVLLNIYEIETGSVYQDVTVSYEDANGNELANGDEYASFKFDYLNTDGVVTGIKATTDLPEEYMTIVFTMNMDEEVLATYFGDKDLMTDQNWNYLKKYFPEEVSARVRVYVQDAVEAVTITDITPDVTNEEEIINSEDLLKLNVNDQYILTAEVSPEYDEVPGLDRELIWTSSDPSTVMVDSFGIITALKPGTVKIYATSKQNTSAQDAITVKVVDNTPIMIGKTIICDAIVRATPSTSGMALYRMKRGSTVYIYGEIGDDYYAIQKGTSEDAEDYAYIPKYYVKVTGSVTPSYVNDPEPVTITYNALTANKATIYNTDLNGKERQYVVPADTKLLIIAEDDEYFYVEFGYSVGEDELDKTGKIAKSDVSRVAGYENGEGIEVEYTSVDGQDAQETTVVIIDPSTGAQVERGIYETIAIPATVTATSAPVYSSFADAPGIVMGRLYQGTSVTIVSQLYLGYYQIKLANGTVCWINQLYLTKDNGENTTATTTTETVTMGKLTKKLNLRAAASKYAKSLTTVAKNSYVTVTGDKVNGYYPVETESGEVGYVSAKYVKVFKQEVTTTTYTSEKQLYGTPNCRILNVRNQPDMDSTVIGALHNSYYYNDYYGETNKYEGDQVRIVTTITDADGIPTWYHVILPDDTYGYVAAEYMDTYEK